MLAGVAAIGWTGWVVRVAAFTGTGVTDTVVGAATGAGVGAGAAAATGAGVGAGVAAGVPAGDAC